MGKSSPKIADPLKSLQGQAFPGIVTPAFSLQRQTPATTTTTSASGGSFGGLASLRPSDFSGMGLEGDVPQIVRVAQRAARQRGGTTTTTTAGSGPFALTRTDPFVPNKESELFQLLERNRLGIGSLFGNINATRGQLAGQQGRAGGLFDETGRLRENLLELLGEVRPGFGRLTEAARETIRNRFSESVGNLREALAKRGLQGSSFAINETRRAELDFAQQEEQVVSEAIVQEIGLRRQIIGDAAGLIQLDQATLQTQAVQVGLQLGLNEQEAGVFRDEMVNIQSQAALLGQRIARELQELGLAGNIINQQQAIVADLAKAQAQLTAQAAADSGSLFGTIFGSLAGIAASAVAPTPIGLGAIFT